MPRKREELVNESRSMPQRADGGILSMRTVGLFVDSMATTAWTSIVWASLSC